MRLVIFLLFTFSASAKPNFVVLADDLGYGDVGYQGGDVPTRTLIPSQVREWFLLRYITCPVCSIPGRFTDRQVPAKFWFLGQYRLSVSGGGTWDSAEHTNPFRTATGAGYVCGLFGKTYEGDRRK